MKNNLIHKFEYTKSPYKAIYFSFTIKIALAIILIIALALAYKNSDFAISIILLLFCFAMFILISLFYSPVLYRINTYLSLEIYKDMLIINDKEYPINEIFYKINEYRNTGAGTYRIYIYWYSIQFFDKNNKKIGEFFFTISYENNLTNIPLKTLIKIIDDLKNNENYNCEDTIEKQVKELKEENIVYGYANYLMILYIFAPLLVLLLIFLFKN
ncbi:hypothetical protein ACN2EN_10380 [Aliarcobacter lanthieri]|uniref:hypothetical protein n=1 Tax=Aliarcobacter lanthieri TaxID=1355374 RepID=UPI003AFA1C81